jgi:hypothetical protein
MCFSSFAERDREHKCEHIPPIQNQRLSLKCWSGFVGLRNPGPTSLPKSGPMIALMPNVMKFIAPVALPFIAPPNPTHTLLSLTALFSTIVDVLFGYSE